LAYFKGMTEKNQAGISKLSKKMAIGDTALIMEERKERSGEQSGKACKEKHEPSGRRKRL